MGLQVGQFVILYNDDGTVYLGGIVRDDDVGYVYLFKEEMTGDINTAWHTRGNYNNRSIIVDNDIKLRDFLYIIDKIDIEELKGYDDNEYVINILTKLQERTR